MTRRPRPYLRGFTGSTPEIMTQFLDQSFSQCSTVGDRAFAVAGARLWNSLPHDIVTSDTLSHFRRGLKTFLFRQSYPSILF